MTLCSISSGSVGRGRRACACIGAAALLVSAAPRAAWAQAAGSPPASAATATQAPAAPAAPAPPEPDPLGFFKSTEIGGLVDAYYDWYSTKPDGDAQYRNFDTRHNQFTLGMAQIWVAKAPTDKSRAGFKVKLSYGPATSLVQSFEPGGPGPLANIEEGYASYLAPVGKGLQFDVGKFVTPNGAEVIEAKDNWNYSRSLLFALAIPYYHAGVRATYSPTAKVTLMGLVVNGWNDVTENNTGKTVGAQIAFKPTGALSLVQNYMVGPEQTADNSDLRQLADTIVTYTVNPKVSVMANYDYGKDTIAGTKVHWQGIAGYAKVQANKVVAFSPRVEWYDDPSGFTTGAVQKLKEVTGTLELKSTEGFMWRIEYRTDFSDSAVFKNQSGALKKNQSSIGFGVLYSFSTKG
jgi:hypothetical protein